MLLLLAEAADVREHLSMEEVFVAVVRVVGGFECLVVQTVVLDPVVDGALERKSCTLNYSFTAIVEQSEN